MNDERLRFCDVPTALEEIRAGRILAIVDDQENPREGALVMASAEPTPEALRFMVSTTSGLVCMAAPERDLRKVTLPASLRDACVLGAIFCLPSAHCHNVPVPESSGSRMKLQVIPFTTRKGGVLRHARPAECISDLAGLIGGKQYCFFSSFGSDQVASATKAFSDLLRTQMLKVLSTTELIRYRLSREEHVRSKSALLVRSRFGDFQFRRIESDVFDHCAVLVKGEERGFDQRPPLVRIETIPSVGGMCACLPTCMEASFQDAVELMYRDGQGIIVFLPSMRDCSFEEVAQKFNMEYFRDDPFSTLEDSMIHRVTSAGMCAQILHLLGAKYIRLISKRPRRVRDLETFGIHIVEDIPVSCSQQQFAAAPSRSVLFK
jgi:3,4-dihydroxy 2-butanone 4-phosphate synthase/GTP cyclohydrolase II